MNAIPEPDKTYRIKGWTITIRVNWAEAWCTNTNGKTLILKPTTYHITRLPLFVQRKLNSIGFMGRWREYQARESLNRLQYYVTKLSEIDKKRNEAKDITTSL